MSAVTLVAAPAVYQNADDSIVESTNLVALVPQFPWDRFGPVTATVAYIPRYMLEAFICFIAISRASMLDGSMANKLTTSRTARSSRRRATS